MGCRHACTCSGNCGACSGYEEEKYVGQAEEEYDELNGEPEIESTPEEEEDSVEDN